MSTPLVYYIRSTAFDRSRALTFDGDAIHFDDKDLIGQNGSCIGRTEFDAVRMGVKWIKGYSVVIGRIYCIDIRSTTGIEIKVRLKSVYGINKQLITSKYQEIVNSLYDLFLNGVIMDKVETVNEGNSILLAGMQISNAGVSWNSGQMIPWEEVGIKTYNSYYAVFQKSIPNNYKPLEYVNEWNCHILYSVLMVLLKDKGLLAES